MKGDGKHKKKERDESPINKKPKRLYRNDRSKKGHDSSSEMSSNEDSKSSCDDERKMKGGRRSKSKKKNRKPRPKSSDFSDSPSPERKKIMKKRTKRSSSSDRGNVRKVKKSCNKYKSSSGSERSVSGSPTCRMKHSSQSPPRQVNRSEIKSPVFDRKGFSKRKRCSRSRSNSPALGKKHKTQAHSKTKSPIMNKKKRSGDRRKSKSPEQRRESSVIKCSNSPDSSQDSMSNEVKKISKAVVAHYDEVEQDMEIETKLIAIDDKAKSQSLKDVIIVAKEEEKGKQIELQNDKQRLEVLFNKKEEKLSKLEEQSERKRKEERYLEKKYKAEDAHDSDKESKRKERKQKVREKKEDEEKLKRKAREEEKQKEKEHHEGERIKQKEQGRAKENEIPHEKDRRKEKENDRDKRYDTEKLGEDRRKESKKEKSPERKKVLCDAEEEMRKRKERIEAWKEGRKVTDDKTEESNANVEKKKWSLEDDDDEDDTEKQKDDENKEVSEDEDLDPLDAYMKSIDKEINKSSAAANTKGSNTKTKTVTFVTTVVKKPTEVKDKPELIEQNQDAMEYSSEEEAPADVTASDFADVKKKKDYIVTDHSKIYYAPFRRDFYVEVPELARMTAEEVKQYRESLGDIQVRGKNIPKPLKSWAQAGLNTKVMNVLKRCGYEKPTPIQAQAIPAIMSGRDMIGIAKTGSGKTLAFVLPMLRHVLDQAELGEEDGPIAIIMTPTRELALQIFRESKKFCKPLHLTVTCIYGGSGISEQIAELKRGAEIIVCTPGRMIDMLAVNNGKVTNCRRCTYLVLDEADRMFDMGFEPQVMRIVDNIRPDRQTVLFSATFPRQMEAVARKVLTKPIEIQVGGRSVVCSDIQQNAIVIEAENKFFKLLELLGVYQEQGSVLVFVEKQETADSLFKDLLKKGYPCLSLHGGMDQFDRDSTISDFKNGVTKLMVSTSVAARGLDVKNLILVINYDCPNHYEDYVHRVGRTGRAGNKGTAFTFLTPDQGRCCGDIVKAFELSKCEPPPDVLALWNEYKEDMAKEGKKVKLNSGFTGKGFKFNQEEEQQVNESKKMRKFTLGLQDSDDEAEAAENAMEKIEADLEKAFSNKPKVALAPEIVEAQKAKAAETNVDKGKLKLVDDIAAKINKKLSSGGVIDRNAAATAHILQGGALDSLTGVGLAKHFADKLNAKLNYKAVTPEAPAEPEKSVAIRYEEEIDINDFPQQARWRITSKEIIEQVRELSEAGVTVRGVYVPPNKKNEDEKRLHLYIESLNERSIQIAKAEIKRLLREELIRAESNVYRPQQQGRYKVV